ncbi:MAG: PhzF family phenazine biosynthesis protein [Thermodesulfobacteriota bacterium]
MEIPVYQVDAFANTPFSGNPAAVCLLEHFLPVSTMQAIAAENNLSETVFMVLQDDVYHLRWFSPVTEVDLCGHATLAAAHVLFRHLDFPGDRIRFASRCEPLAVYRAADWLYLDFPADELEKAGTPRHLAEGLGTEPAAVLRGWDDYLAVFENEKTIRSIVPDRRILGQVASRGVIVTAPGNQVDFVSRFFAPQMGLPEDPVTGSAHTSLIPYWSNVLDKQEMTARQLSDRGGHLHCLHRGKRVEIGGQAVTYMVGRIMIENGE